MTDTGGIVIERDLMVPARDGVLLATDVYRPHGPGPFPVLLERTPYDKSASSRSERSAAVARPRSRTEVAAYFVGYGYAVAYQDCRGRYRSGGHFTKYLSEAEDGYDALAWLQRQPWCNGRVGTFGLSYAAHTQAARVWRQGGDRFGQPPGRAGRAMPGRSALRDLVGPPARSQ
jgi:putative CocE/NonD family hydrolase